ncbi:MAG: YceI family protein [Verrucomicrobiota bacterium]
MKKQIIRITMSLALVSALTASAQVRDFKSKPGEDTKARVEGTSNIHDWWVEGKLISGLLKLDDAALAKVGKVAGEAKVIIPINTLHSSSGAKMDDVMYEHMEVEKQPEFRKIMYLLEELTVKKPATATTAAECDSKGSLVIHGVTNKIDMPITIQKVEEDNLKISGTVSLKITQFGIKPPSPALAMGLIKTGDDIKVIVNWRVAPVAK